MIVLGLFKYYFDCFDETHALNTWQRYILNKSMLCIEFEYNSDEKFDEINYKQQFLI